jgi:uncharacterized membrane protein
MSQNLGLFVHLLGVILWIGGMTLLYFCLRPAAMALPPPQRLPLWVAVFSRFFPLVWASIALILLSGFGKLGMIGFAAAPKAWHVMMLIGLVMVALFASIWFGPWVRLKHAVAVGDWPAGAAALNSIRQRVAINLTLGMITVAVATLGLALL